MKVLHVTEALGGGVTTAINTYVDNSSWCDHYLFATSRTSDSTGQEKHGAFKGINIADRGPGAVWQFFKYYREVNPDAVHLHSSIAGALVRVLPFVSKSKIIYTPHAFSFLRNDAQWKLSIYRLIEQLLAFRVAVYAGCGKEEVNISKQLAPAAGHVELTNICSDLSKSDYTVSFKPKTVGMIGRLCEQKGVDFFGEVAAKLKGELEFVWIGGGDENYSNDLELSGVRVTGWVDRSSALEELNKLDVYFHSAAWDGFPISVLEAASLEKPMLLRSIGPFLAENLFVVNSPDDAAESLRRYYLDDDDTKEAFLNNYKNVQSYHSKERLVSALKELYGNWERKK